MSVFEGTHLRFEQIMIVIHELMHVKIPLDKRELLFTWNCKALKTLLSCSEKARIIAKEKRLSLPIVDQMEKIHKKIRKFMSGRAFDRKCCRKFQRATLPCVRQVLPSDQN